MSLRQLLNVVYAHLMKGRDEEGKAVLNELLEEKRWVEMSEPEQKKFLRKIEAIKTGAYQSQKRLVGVMGMPQGRRRTA